jgi:hypothetical protein
MLWSQVGVTLRHSYVRQTAKLLQHVNRCVVLNMPACPCMAQIVPTKIIDTYLDQRIPEENDRGQALLKMNRRVPVLYSYVLYSYGSPRQGSPTCRRPWR